MIRKLRIKFILVSMLSALLVLSVILGIVNVCNGEKKELPIVSGIRFIRR